MPLVALPPPLSPGLMNMLAARSGWFATTPLSTTATRTEEPEARAQVPGLGGVDVRIRQAGDAV